MLSGKLMKGNHKNQMIIHRGHENSERVSDQDNSEYYALEKN